MTKELNAIFTIAFRDVTKLLRDRVRLIASLIFPLIFIGVLGGGLNQSFGERLGYSYLTFIFTGVLAQVLFSSTASGVIFLLEDRENDFSKELFVAPVSPYSIIFGKIFGESLVAVTQGVAIVLFSVLLGVRFTLLQIVWLVPIALACTLLGGAFGFLVLANLNTQRRANQIFPFLIFPQFFLSGAFNPARDFPWYLTILSTITPLAYGVDLLRGVFYRGTSEFSEVVIRSPIVNLLFIAFLFTLFIIIGTALFVKNERER